MPLSAVIYGEYSACAYVMPLRHYDDAEILLRVVTLARGAVTPLMPRCAFSLCRYAITMTAMIRERVTPYVKERARRRHTALRRLYCFDTSRLRHYARYIERRHDMMLPYAAMQELLL